MCLILEAMTTCAPPIKDQLHRPTGDPVALPPPKPAVNSSHCYNWGCLGYRVRLSTLSYPLIQHKSNVPKIGHISNSIERCLHYSFVASLLTPPLTHSPPNLKEQNTRTHMQQKGGGSNTCTQQHKGARGPLASGGPPRLGRWLPEPLL